MKLHRTGARQIRLLLSLTTLTTLALLCMPAVAQTATGQTRPRLNCWRRPASRILSASASGGCPGSRNGVCHV